MIAGVVKLFYESHDTLLALINEQLLVQRGRRAVQEEAKVEGKTQRYKRTWLM